MTILVVVAKDDPSPVVVVLESVDMGHCIKPLGTNDSSSHFLGTTLLEQQRLSQHHQELKGP